MSITSILHFLFHGNQLKRTARTGWGQRGVPNPEDVAAHSYGVVLATLVLAQMVDKPIDVARALAMAALHDLPEALTSDIPSPAWRYLPPGIKSDVERGVLTEMLADVPFADEMVDLWEELHANQTAVAKLVHDADKIDLLIQAYMYEKQTGNQQLEEFWQPPYRFHFPEAQALYNALVEMRA